MLGLVRRLNADPKIHGILVQFPVPKHIDPNKILLTISPAKDVDCFTPESVGRLQIGLPGPVSCTPLGCLMLLRDFVGNLSGKHAVIVGRSNLVGKPMAQLLLRENCTVTVAHSRTADLPGIVRQADIVVAAVGPAADDQGRLDQAGRGGDRRGHQPGAGAGQGRGQDPPGRRCGLCGGAAASPAGSPRYRAGWDR